MAAHQRQHKELASKLPTSAVSMKCGTVIVLGNLATKCLSLDRLAGEFGWLLETTVGIDVFGASAIPWRCFFIRRRWAFLWTMLCDRCWMRRRMPSPSFAIHPRM